MSEGLTNWNVAEVIADDVVDHLITDFSQHDKIYISWSRRKVGREARREARFYGIRNRDRLEAVDASPTLFPEIQTSELEVAMQGFARGVGDEYVSELFRATYRPYRSTTREVFLIPNGDRVCARTYLDNIWAPKYAGEFVTAHTLGLTKKLAEITGGAEVIS